MVNNATIPEFLRELERAQADLASEYRRVTEVELRVAPAEGEWSCLEAAQHIAPTYRFWIIWIHRIRTALRGLELAGMAPVEKTVYGFSHPSAEGVTIPELQASLAELRQVTNELVDLLGWVPQAEYVMELPAVSEAQRALLIEGPLGHTNNLALPAEQQHAGLSRLLAYAGGFSVRGSCGHVLEGHTANHTRQFAAARQAVAARLAQRV